MDLAAASFSWPGMPFEFALDLISALEIEGVSLAFIGGLSADEPVAVAAAPEATAERVRGQLEQRGQRPADVFLVPDGSLGRAAVNDPDPAERAVFDELFGAFLRFASAVGSTGLTVLPGLVFGGEDHERALDRSAQALRRRVDEAAAAGLRLSVEPHIVSTRPYRGSVIDTPSRVARLLELVPGLELTLDYGHFNVQGIPDREVEPLLDYARHVHVRGGAPGFVQAKLADNVTDFGRILDRLADRNYDGWVEIEYVHDERPGCSDCDNVQEIRKLRDHLRGHEADRGR